MPHYTDKDMSYEEFSKLLKDRYEKGESTDDYSYKSDIKYPFTCIIVDNIKGNKSSIDYSEFIEKVKTMIENEGLRVVVKQLVEE